MYLINFIIELVSDSWNESNLIKWKNKKEYERKPNY